MNDLDNHSPPPLRPPGPDPRPLPSPTRQGTLPFRIPSTSELAHTFYAIWGNPTPAGPPPLVVIHGGPSLTHSYLTPIAHLHTTHSIPVILYDQVGCGRSTRFPGRRTATGFWTLDLFLAELENLVRGLGLTEYDLLGHSWGGILGVMHAASGRGRVRRLVLCSVPADVEGWRGVEGRLIRELPTELANPLLTLPVEAPAYQAAMVGFYRRHLCRVPAGEGFPAPLLASMAALAGDSTAHDALLRGPLAGWEAGPYLGKLDEITVPGGMLLVNGAFDEAGVEEGAMMPYFVGTGVRRVRWFVFGRSAQMAWLEEREAFGRVVGGFLMGGEGRGRRGEKGQEGGSRVDGEGHC